MINLRAMRSGGCRTLVGAGDGQEALASMDRLNYRRLEVQVSTLAFVESAWLWRPEKTPQWSSPAQATPTGVGTCVSGGGMSTDNRQLLGAIVGRILIHLWPASVTVHGLESLPPERGHPRGQGVDGTAR